MRNSLIVLLCLAAGIGSGFLALMPKGILDLDPTMYTLYLLLFLVGMEIGSDAGVWQTVRRVNLRFLLAPFSAVVGTIFALVTLLHLLRIYMGWPVVIGSWALPMWVSWIGFVVAGSLSYFGLRLAARN